MNTKIFKAIHSRKTCFRFFRSRPSREPIRTSNLKTCVELLQWCARNRELSEGRKVHSHMIVSDQISSPIAVNSLINMYSKCSSAADAISVFNSSTEVHNVFVYNAIIAGLTVNNLPFEAFEIYRKMRAFGIEPDKFTFPSAIKACSDASDLRSIHVLLVKLELTFDEFIGTALLKCYLRFELVDDALKVFDGLPVKYYVELWNAMINGFRQIGDFGKAISIFKRMVEMGLVPDTFSVSGVLPALALAADFENGRMVHSFAVKMGYVEESGVLSALMDMYGKCKKLEDALMVFDSMIEKDMYSWNTIINVHQQCGDYEGTLRVLKMMIRLGFQPNQVTLASALPACSHLSELVHGKEIHGYIIRKDLDNLGNMRIANALMDMYAKCGSIKQARTVFDGKRCKDVSSWNNMVLCYGLSGSEEEALSLFYQMCESGLKPDAISFIGVLAACGRGGFVSEGKKILEEMETKYGVKPEIKHYSCVVRMLGQSGNLQEAFEMISNMPVKPNHEMWRSFLGSCKLHGNTELAKIAVKKTLELDPDHSRNYVPMSFAYGAAGRYAEVEELRSRSWITPSDGNPDHSENYFPMSNAYGAAGRHAEVEEVTSMTREKEVNTTPSCSWIMLSDVAHLFSNGERGFPDECFVYDVLDSLTASLRGHGFMVDAVECCV